MAAWRALLVQGRWVSATYQDIKVVGRILAVFEGPGGQPHYDIELPLQDVRVVRRVDETILIDETCAGETGCGKFLRIGTHPPTAAHNRGRSKDRRIPAHGPEPVLGQAFGFRGVAAESRIRIACACLSLRCRHSAADGSASGKTHLFHQHLAVGGARTPCCSGARERRHAELRNSLSGKAAKSDCTLAYWTLPR